MKSVINVLAVMTIVSITFGVLVLMLFFTSCTVLFKNISTHGSTSLDELEKVQTDPEFNPDLTFPFTTI